MVSSGSFTACRMDGGCCVQTGGECWQGRVSIGQENAHVIYHGIVVAYNNFWAIYCDFALHMLHTLFLEPLVL